MLAPKPKIIEEPVRWFFYAIREYELLTQCIVAAITSVIVNLWILRRL